MPPSWGHFDGFLQRAGGSSSRRGRSRPRRPAQLTLWLGLLGRSPFLLLVASVAASRSTGGATAGCW